MHKNLLKEYQVEKIKKLKKVQIAQWQKLWEETIDVHFFNSPTHFLSFLEIFPRQEYLVVFCYRENELVAVLPLIYGKKFRRRTLMCPDSFGKSIDRSALCLKTTDIEALREIIKSITKDENLYLAELEEKHLSLLMQGGKKISKHCFSEFSCRSPRLIFKGNLCDNMSKKTRKKFQKKLKKAEELVSFKFYRRNEIVDFEKMVEIENRSWKKTKKIALFERELTKKVYTAWIKNNQQNIGVAFLSIDNQQIAYLFGIFSKDTFLITNSAFVLEFGKITPGSVLVFHTLKYLEDAGIRMVDFSVGDSRWKREFANQFPKQHNFYFSKNKANCIFWRGALLCKKIFKKFIRSKQKFATN